MLYVRRDTTLASGQTVRIFVPATAADAAAGADVFRVRFSRVATGQGDYRRAGQARNGIVYEYAGPGQGDAVAFRRLPRPSRRGLLDVSGAAEPVRGVQLFGELAQSIDDVNTLAQGAAQTGLASETGLRLLPRRLGPGEASAEIVRRARGDAFRTLDRVRDVEFNRRWNLVPHRLALRVRPGLAGRGRHRGDGRVHGSGPRDSPRSRAGGSRSPASARTASARALRSATRRARGPARPAVARRPPRRRPHGRRGPARRHARRGHVRPRARPRRPHVRRGHADARRRARAARAEPRARASGPTRARAARRRPARNGARGQLRVPGRPPRRGASRAAA